MKQSQVLKDAYPRRIFVHCISLKCHATVQSMKQVICDVDECRIVQNWQRLCQNDYDTSELWGDARGTTVSVLPVPAAQQGFGSS